LLKYLERVGIALSVLLNVVLNGYSNQTFSARNWGWKRENRTNLVFIIDSVFNMFATLYNILPLRNELYNFSNHCKRSWTYWSIRKHKG